MKYSKGQVAFEYIVIIMAVMAFILPVWVYVSGMQRDAIYQLSLSYAENTVENIASTANLVYSQGPPAKLTLRVYIPGGVQSTSITGSMIIISMLSGSGETDVWSMSLAELNGSLPTEEGNYIVTLEAIGDYVQIGV